MSDDAVDGGAEGSTDTGSSDATTTDATEDSGSETSVEKGGETKAESRLKIRRYGKDAEYTPSEMAKMLDDDYEWDFHGAGGKPLMRDGKPVKQKWRDIVRSVQQSHGAAESARKYNEEFKRLNGIAAWAKEKDDSGKYRNLDVFMQDHLGIEDFDTWALQRAAEAFDRRQKLAELAQKDPFAYERELRGDLEKRDARGRTAKQRMAEREQGELAARQREEAFVGKLGEVFKPHGVPYNARTREIVNQVCQEYADAGAELPFETLAEIVRDQYHDEIFGYLDPKSDDDLLKLLGDKRRERLRQAEVAAHKAKKKEAATSEPAKPKPTNGHSKPERGMTAAEFLRQGRRA